MLPEVLVPDDEEPEDEPELEEPDEELEPDEPVEPLEELVPELDEPDDVEVDVVDVDVVEVDVVPFDDVPELEPARVAAHPALNRATLARTVRKISLVCVVKLPSLSSGLVAHYQGSRPQQGNRNTTVIVSRVPLWRLLSSRTYFGQSKNCTWGQAFLSLRNRILLLGLFDMIRVATLARDGSTTPGAAFPQ